ncbi:MAG: hypothetical protein N2484_04490 [Clostridia bacterium]|nr:hypothetical protein [Clostridia bacterium]
MRKTIDRLTSFKMEKGWMWLLYLDIILPLLLFIPAYFLSGSGLGASLARLFHSYTLYISSPIPDLASLTGILGMLIHIGAILYGLKKKDWNDVFLSLGISILAFLYIFFEINYRLSYMLKFTA